MSDRLPLGGPSGPPPKMIAGLHRGLDAVAWLFKVLAVLILAIMVGLNLFNIFCRSFLDHAYGWVFDWTMLMFIWMLLLGLYAYMRERRDVVVDIFMSRLPGIPRRLAGLFACAVGMAVMAAILKGAPSLLVLQTAPMDTIDLPIYARSALLFVSAGLILVHFALDFICIAFGWHEAFAREDEAPLAAEKGAIE